MGASASKTAASAVKSAVQHAPGKLPSAQSIVGGALPHQGRPGVQGRVIDVAAIRPPQADAAYASVTAPKAQERKPFTYEDGESLDAPSNAPNDPGSAEVAKEVAAAASGEDGTTTPVVAVRRLMSSGPADENAATLHDKNTTTVSNVSKFDGAIASEALNDAGIRSIAVWHAMQENPALLDTPAALARSASAVAALGILQLAAGDTRAAPAGTRLIGTPAVLTEAQAVVRAVEEGEVARARLRSGQEAQPPALPAVVAAPPPADSTAVIAVPSDSTALAVIEATAESIVPLGWTLDGMLLSLEAPGALVESWGSRPAEGSVYDQLVLNSEGPGKSLLLDRGELFELFARARADPAYWTPEALASFYGTRADWVAALLDSVSPPIFAAVDGDAYGVYDIRLPEEMDKSA